MCYTCHNPTYQSIAYDGVLASVMFICFMGLVITSALMLPGYLFFQTKDGKRLSMIKLEFPQRYDKLQDTLLSTSQKAKDVVRFNLRMDFIFMPCLYILMYCLARLIWLHSGLNEWQASLGWICFLPYANWLLDILENTMTFEVLSDPTKKNALFMFIFSTLKWLAGLVYIVYLLAMGVAYLIAISQ